MGRRRSSLQPAEQSRGEREDPSNFGPPPREIRAAPARVRIGEVGEAKHECLESSTPEIRLLDVRSAATGHAAPAPLCLSCLGLVSVLVCIISG